MKLAQRKNILKALGDALTESLGFVGDTSVPKLVFLSLYTRFLDKPVSLIVKGPSGSGKSFAVDCGLAFIPPYAYEPLSGITPKSLVYMENISLRHRFLYIGERAGMVRKGDPFLRQLLSQHRVRYAYVSRKSGKPQTEIIDLEGPTGMIMTTTDIEIDAEDANRCLSVKLKCSPDKIREALLAQTKKREPLDTAPWFELHKNIGEGVLQATVPFEAKIAKKMPATSDREMRDFRLVCSLIKAHALLHQANRDTKKDQVVATIADYEAVYPLVAEALVQSEQDIIPENSRAILEAVERLQADGNGQASKKDAPGVTQTQIGKFLNRPQSFVSRNVKVLLEDQYLKNEGHDGQGNSGRYVIGETKLPKGKVLPEPGEIAA